MQSRDFCYWLQGFFELSLEDQEISAEQATLIRQHLSLVFKHEIDPSMGDQKHQDELNEIHSVKISDDIVDNYWEHKYGPCPHPGWEVGIHGWYDPNGAIPRC